MKRKMISNYVGQNNMSCNQNNMQPNYINHNNMQYAPTANVNNMVGANQSYIENTWNNNNNLGNNNGCCQPHNMQCSSNNYANNGGYYNNYPNNMGYGVNYPNYVGNNNQSCENMINNNSKNEYNPNVIHNNSNEQQNMYVGKTKVVKSNWSKKFKLFLIVYLVLVTLVGAMLFTNYLVGGKNKASASNNDSVLYNESTINTAVDSEGNIIELNKNNDDYDYTYTMEKSWFEKLCENITSNLG